MLANTVKEGLSDASGRIRLDDLVMTKLRETLVAISPENFPLDSRPATADEMAARLRKYHEAVSDLSTIAVLLAKWGTEAHVPTLGRMLSRLADGNQRAGGVSLWLHLRWYPLQLLCYYAGIAALSSENYEALAQVFRAQSSPGPGEDPLFVFAQANSALTDLHEDFRRLPGHEKQRTPRSEHLHKELQPLLDDLNFLGSSYEELFDRFEILNALAHMPPPASGSRRWGPPGRFAWKYQNAPNGGLFGRMEREASAAGNNWPPLRAHLFSGSSEELLKRFEDYRVILDQLGWY